METPLNSHTAYKVKLRQKSMSKCTVRIVFFSVEVFFHLLSYNERENFSTIWGSAFPNMREIREVEIKVKNTCQTT